MSRNSIKLVTEPSGVRDSSGNEKQQMQGIELIAGNNAPGLDKVEPLVKADSLRDVLNGMIDQINIINGTFFKFVDAQQKFNIAVNTHVHPEPVLLGMLGIFAPFLGFAAGPINIIDNVAMTLPNVISQKINLAQKKVTKMAGTPTFASKYNYTN